MFERSVVVLEITTSSFAGMQWFIVQVTEHVYDMCCQAGTEHQHSCGCRAVKLCQNDSM